MRLPNFFGKSIFTKASLVTAALGGLLVLSGASSATAQDRDREGHYRGQYYSDSRPYERSERNEYYRRRDYSYWRHERQEAFERREAARHEWREENYQRRRPYYNYSRDND